MSGSIRRGLAVAVAATLSAVATAQNNGNGSVAREGQAGEVARSAILDLSSGDIRPLLGDIATRAPRWSPDGQRIVLQTLDESTWKVTIVRADGSDRRTYAVPATLINAQTVWSPGGTRVAVRTNSELWELDVETGANRRLGPTLHPHHLAWRDEQSIVVVRQLVNASTNAAIWQMSESTATGERLLRDLSREFPDGNPRGFRNAGYFVGPNAYVLINPNRVIVDPYAKDVALPGDGPRSGAPGSSADGKYLVFGVGVETEPVRAIELIDVANRTATIVALPFLARTTAYSRPALLPDHSAVILLGRADSGSAWAFYKVAFATSECRLVATIPGDPQLYHFDLSPDGRRLVFTYDVPARESDGNAHRQRPNERCT